MKNKPNNDIVCLLIEIIGDVYLLNLFGGIKYSNNFFFDYIRIRFVIISILCLKITSNVFSEIKFNVPA